MNKMLGQQISNYRLEALLGMGSMRAVSQVRNVYLNRVVALKMLSQHLAKSCELQQRFWQEMLAAYRQVILLSGRSSEEIVF